ncbi:Uncharacterised protein [Yersinia aleksiciae]|nr:Uncharacterised protein [Yersinia aleksiciae]
MRLHIKGIGIDVCPHGGQIIDLGGQRTADIDLATQMADMLTGRTAITIIRTYLVAGLDGIQQPVAAGIHLQILTDIEAGTLNDKITLGINHRVVTDIDARQRPEYGLIAQHCAIAAAQLFTVSAQD